MNQLSTVTGDASGLSFVLLVDGRSIGDLVSTLSDSAIPYWLVDDGLPAFPPHASTAEKSESRIVAVCSCGEYGCGHVRCRVRGDGDRVVFEAFENDVSDMGKAARFVFQRAS